MVADVWEKDVWDFQAKSGSSGSCCLFLHFLGKMALQKMSGRTPGSPRHPASRHPWPSDSRIVKIRIATASQRYKIARFKAQGQKLTFFHADFGKEFPSRTLWRDPSRNCPSPSSALCPLLYRTEHVSRGKNGKNVPRKGEEEGWPAKGAKRKKGRVKTGQKTVGIAVKALQTRCPDNPSPLN